MRAVDPNPPLLILQRPSPSPTRSWAAVIIGLVAGVVYYGASKGMAHALHLDDPLDAVAVHLCCGFWGVVAVGLFAAKGEGVLRPAPGSSTRWVCTLGWAAVGPASRAYCGTDAGLPTLGLPRSHTRRADAGRL